MMYGIILFSTIALWLGDASGEYLRVCYYKNWAQYRPESCKFYPEDIDPHLCTHIVYAFATMSNHTLAPYEWNDDDTDWFVGMYTRVLNQAKINPDLKVLLSVGGWNMGSKWSNTLASKETRKIFIDDSICFLRKRGFHGLELHFAFPGSRGSPPEDKERFTALAEEMSAAYEAEAIATGKPRLLLSAAVGVTKEIIDNGYEVDKIHKYFDFVSLTTDTMGTGGNETSLHTALYPGKEDIGTDKETECVDWAVRYWLELGFPSNKLVMGTGASGRANVLKDPNNNGIGAPITGDLSSAGKCTREAGFLSYYEICSNPKLVQRWSEEHRGSYSYDPSTGDPWVSHESLHSIQVKVNYMKAMELLGISVWSLDDDDFNGEFCNLGTYPLIKCINQRIQGGTCMKGSTTVPPSGGTTEPTTLPPKSDCDKVCQNQEDGHRPHPRSCFKFCHCFSGWGYEQSCPGGLYWCVNSNSCCFKADRPEC